MDFGKALKPDHLPLTPGERVFHNGLRQVRNFCQSREVVYGHPVSIKIA